MPNMYGYTNYTELDLGIAVSFQPSHIQFNDEKEWQVFYNRYAAVLRLRRDWYYNSKTLRFTQ